MAELDGNSRGIALIRSGRKLTLGQQLKLTLMLSAPAIMAELSTIVMQYIDAAMVGSLGQTAAASIGLVSTTTWLFWGLLTSAGTGFAVQVAHLLGASRRDDANAVLRQSVLTIFIYSTVIGLIGALISPHLPHWLGADLIIRPGATSYFMVFALSLPVLGLNFLCASMLRCSGNMLVPGVVNVVMCILDVLFNMLLIFPTRVVTFCDISFTMPGAGLGVLGAALGTAIAEVVALGILLIYLCKRKGELYLPAPLRQFKLKITTLRKALKISLPMAGERIVFCSAQILITVIVAPLGNAAIAANAFAITIESLCYMPGFGIADAATALVGQSLGAGRRDLTRSFGRLTVATGVVVMTITGIIMYIFAPELMASMTPDEAVRALGIEALRIEAYTEPLYAASIVAYGVFVGAGDTLIPCCMNLFSIWAVRLTLAYFLAPHLGLAGVWIAMAIELSFRGIIFLIRLFRERWIKSPDKTASTEFVLDNPTENIDTYDL